jgi:DNA-binding XRE family transcriptional regulator
MTKSDTLSDFFLTNKGRRKELIGISLKEFFVFGASRINLLLQLSFELAFTLATVCLTVNILRSISTSDHFKAQTSPMRNPVCKDINIPKAVQSKFITKTFSNFSQLFSLNTVNSLLFIVGLYMFAFKGDFLEDLTERQRKMINTLTQAMPYLRKELGVSQTVLVTKVEMSRQMISLIERGKQPNVVEQLLLLESDINYYEKRRQIK